MTPGALLPIEQLERLRRKKWTDLNEFAQEMYALLGADLPIDSTTPVTLRQTGDDPALTVIPNPTPGPNTQPATNFPGGSGGGGVAPTQIVFPAPASGTVDPAGLAANIPVVLWGSVISKAFGRTYLVRCWMLDPLSGPPLGDFYVIIAQVDTSDEVPPGTEGLVWCSLGTGFLIGAMRMQVPLFLS